MQTLHKEDNLNIMQDNIDLINDVAKLREAVKNEKVAFNNAGGTKALDQIKAAKEKLAQEAAQADTEGFGRGRHAAYDDELEQVDGFDNSLANNLATKKRHI